MVETAVGRLDEFIENACALESKQRGLAGLVAPEHVAVYEDSARITQVKINEALYLGS